MSNALSEIVNSIIDTDYQNLIALTESELVALWHWRWEGNQNTEWNTYTFSTALELYKKRCRRWEEYHHGPVCVVERVRDKYIMPRVREYLVELATHRNK